MRGSLPGELQIKLLDDFLPADDTRFQIFNAGTLSGMFSSVLLPELSGNLSWDHSHLYSSGTLSVIPEPATLTLLAVFTLLTCGRRRRYRQ